MPMPTYSPKEGIGARYIDRETGRGYVFTRSGWRTLNIKIEQQDNPDTFVVKPEEKEMETKLLQGGADITEVQRALAERRRVVQNVQQQPDKGQEVQQQEQINKEEYRQKQMSNPFQNMSKQDLLRAAYNHGVRNKSQLDELSSLYDTLTGSQEVDYDLVGNLVQQREKLSTAGFSTTLIDNKLQELGFAKGESTNTIATGEAAKYAPAVSRAFSQLEEISGIGTDNSIFTGGSTSIGKAIKGVGIKARLATDPEFSQKVNSYNNLTTLVVGAVNQMMGAGTLNEGEAERLIKTIPNQYTSDKEAQAWFSNARSVLGVDIDKVMQGNNNQDIDNQGGKGAFGQFIEGVGESIDTRLSNAGDEITQNWDEVSLGGAPRPILRAAGEVAGVVSDTTTELAKLIAPKFIEDAVTEAAGNLSETDLMQKVATTYGNLQKKYPEAMKDIEAMFNISEAIGTGKLAGMATQKASNFTKVKIKNATQSLPFIKKPVNSLDDIVNATEEAIRTGSYIDDIGDELGKAGTAEAKRKIAEQYSKGLNVREKLVGMDEAVKNRISGKPEQLKEYVDVVHTRNIVDTADSAMEYGAKKVYTAKDIIESKLDDVGSDIGSFRRKASTYRVPTDKLDDIENTFSQELKKLNLEINKGQIRQIPGTVTKTGAKKDIGVLQDLFNDLKTTKQGGNLERLIDLRTSFDRKIKYGKTAREISDSVDPVSRSVRRKIADTAADIVGPTEANRLREYSNLMDGLDMLKYYTDKKTGSEFLLKQVLSERSRAPREVMEAIKKYTDIDLMDDAVMASVATDVWGNKVQKGLFEQEIAQAGLDASRAVKGDPRGLFNLFYKTVKKRILNEEKIYLDAAKTGK